jgi:hypothetical protein
LLIPVLADAGKRVGTERPLRVPTDRTLHAGQGRKTLTDGTANPEINRPGASPFTSAAVDPSTTDRESQQQTLPVGRIPSSGDGAPNEYQNRESFHRNRVGEHQNPR